MADAILNDLLLLLSIERSERHAREIICVFRFGVAFGSRCYNELDALANEIRRDEVLDARLGLATLVDAVH